MISKIEDLLKTGNILEASKLIESIDEPVEKLIWEAILLEKQSKFESSLAKGRDAISKVQFENKELLLRAVVVTLYSYWRLGKYQLGMDLVKSLNIEVELKYTKPRADFYNILGLLLWSMGDLDLALKRFQLSYKIRKQLNLHLDIAASLNNMAIIFQLKGDLIGAMDYYTKALEIDLKHGNKIDLGISYNNIGNLYRLQGDYLNSLQYFEKSLKIRISLDIPHEIASSLTSLGHLYYLMGEFEKAEENLKESLQIVSSINNEQLISEILLLLIRNSLSSGSVDSYYEQLEFIGRETEDPYVSQNYNIAKALILKKAKRMRDKVDAQRLLESLKSSKILDIEKHLIIMLNLCDLLIDELKLTGESDVLQDTKQLITEIFDFVEEQKAYPIQIKILILQSKLSMIENEIPESMYYLDTAEQISEENQLSILSSEIRFTREKLTDQMEKWKEMTSILDKINQSEIQNYLMELERSTRL
ncbi:MAG: tetratricopeptide repeat protein [Candidatus Heimdallarchaeota archaeon]|nr:tetratricopeptide repeat protein [Candidatus Heimdallarchaeota archaeon]